MKTFLPSLGAAPAATLLLVSLVLPSSAAGGDAAFHRTPGGSFVVRAAPDAVRSSAEGGRMDLVDAPTRTLARFEAHRVTLPPGGSMPAPSRRAQETFLIVERGLLDVAVEGRTARLSPGSMAWIAAHDPHAATNAGDAPATYLAMSFQPATTPARPAAEARPVLASTLWSWPELAVKPTRTGERRDVVDGPTRTLVNFECHLTTLLPGNAPHAGHRHPDEEIFVVKEGTMEATVGGETHRFGPGDWLFVASGEEHGWRNVGATPATYHVIRFVTPATPVR